MNRSINKFYLENAALKKGLQRLKSSNQSKVLVIHKDASSVLIDVKDDEVSKEKMDKYVEENHQLRSTNEMLYRKSLSRC